MHFVKNQLLPFDGTAILFENFLTADFAAQAFDEIKKKTHTPLKRILLMAENRK